MEEVRETIGIDKIDMSKNMIFVEEHHNADANFILHAITSHCIDRNHIICFVLFHNTFSHFHNVGVKLGYNLMKLRNSTVRVIEPLNILYQNIHNENMQNSNSNSLEFDINNKTSDLIKQIVQLIKNECISIKKETDSQKVFLVIDDLSHLFDIGLNIPDVWRFIRYIRSFVNIEPFLTICIATHVFKAPTEFCEPNVIAVGLRHFAELVISIQPLETGHSKNVSGKMNVCWKSLNQRLKTKHPEEMVYLFKLYDRQVKLFAPGSLHAM